MIFKVIGVKVMLSSPLLRGNSQLQKPRNLLGGILIKKFRSRGQKGSTSQQRESLPSSPRETTPFDSDSSSGSSPYEDFHE